MSTQFYEPKYKKEGYQAVRRWNKRVDIFGKRFLLIPVHLVNHWCLAVSAPCMSLLLLPLFSRILQATFQIVDFLRKRIYYLDSMHDRGGGNNFECIALIA